jgi:hypothetical protein
MRTYKPVVWLAFALPTAAIIGAEAEAFLQASHPRCVVQIELCAEEWGRPLHVPDQFGSAVYLTGSSS